MDIFGPSVSSMEARIQACNFVDHCLAVILSISFESTNMLLVKDLRFNDLVFLRCENLNYDVIAKNSFEL